MSDFGIQTSWQNEGFSTNKGIDFVNFEGKRIINLQMVKDGIAHADADFEDGVCRRFASTEATKTIAKDWLSMQLYLLGL